MHTRTTITPGGLAAFLIEEGIDTKLAGAIAKQAPAAIAKRSPAAIANGRVARLKYLTRVALLLTPVILNERSLAWAFANVKWLSKGPLTDKQLMLEARASQEAARRLTQIGHIPSLALMLGPEGAVVVFGAECCVCNEILGPDAVEIPGGMPGAAGLVCLDCAKSLGVTPVAAQGRREPRR